MKDRLLEKKSSEFRLLNGLSSTEAVHLKSLLTKLEILTVFRPLVGDISGMAIFTEQAGTNTRFMLVNSKQSPGRQHFTICHELYHLFIQENFTYQVCVTGRFDKKAGEEFSADVFASYFLLPTDGLLALIPDDELPVNKITLKTLLKIENYFQCSRKALLMRLKTEEIINGNGFNRYEVNVKKGAMEYGYSTYLYDECKTSELIGPYGAMAKDLFDKEIISETHYLSLLADSGIVLENLKEDSGEN